MGHFLATATPPAMRERLAQLLSDDPSYRVLYYLLGPDRILEWAHSVGAATDRGIAASVSGVPPLELRSIVADPSPQVFMYTGFMDLGICLDHYAKHAPEPPARPAILDFGCGCGRMTRFLDMLASWRAFGSDVSPEHVRWCRQNLRNVDTRLNGTRPPLPFENGQFDLVYSISIFTHLPEHLADAWLGDVARVLKPGGTFITTTHENVALEIIKNSQQHQEMFSLTAEAASALQEGLPRSRFVFLPYPGPVLEADKVGGEYGNSFIHRDYVVERWNRPPWRLLEYAPGGLRGWQDIVVLQRT
jgi:SAM-dependent methyltransferase